jgi:hypothetical protein
MRRSEVLIADIITGPDDAEQIGKAAFELLNEILAGATSPTDLQPLLHSTRTSAVEAGAWVLAELGADAASMMTEIDRLLDDQSRKTRFWAIDALNGAASVADGATLAKAIQLIADDDSAVRWKVLDFLGKMSSDLLTSGLSHTNDDHIRNLLSWLLGPGSDPGESGAIQTRLDHDDRTTRLFAAAAAFRIGRSDASPLEYAATSGDDTISSHARYGLEFSRLNKSRPG